MGVVGCSFLLSPGPWTWTVRLGVKSLPDLGNNNLCADAKNEEQNDPSSLCTLCTMKRGENLYCSGFLHLLPRGFTSLGEEPNVAVSVSSALNTPLHTKYSFVF